jgi:LPPG:FO 2-phospho-L-lactate transferase
MHLQEFWVKHRGRLPVRAVEYQGAKSARATREVVEAILDADRIFISPGNPVSSIGPIISIDGIHTLLSRRKDIVVAVSPLIGPRAISGPAVKYMKATGIKATAEGVANFYSDVAGTIAISNKDAKLAASIEQAGMKVIQTDILMRNKKDEIRLANTLLDQGYKSQ